MRIRKIFAVGAVAVFGFFCGWTAGGITSGVLLGAAAGVAVAADSAVRGRRACGLPWRRSSR